jgi:hypothetical protein
MPTSMGIPALERYASSLQFTHNVSHGCSDGGMGGGQLNDAPELLYPKFWVVTIAISSDDQKNHASRDKKEKARDEPWNNVERQNHT